LRALGRLIFLSLSSILLTGCAASQVFVANPYVRPQRVAVLPMSNDTNDLDGPGYVRQALFNVLTQRGYVLMPIPEIDAKLKEQGFTDGGQLKATTPQKIGEWLGVDGLLYTTLEEFNYIVLGYYGQRTVKIDGHLFNATTGEQLWAANRGWATRQVAVNNKDAERAFAAQLAVKAVEKMTHAPLQLETREAVLRLLNTLP
jgi:hypothetical protein